ncbi:MAG TPA: hypothetical protein VL550_09870 [Rhodocyclaceae bacterium]|jgi:hypothetical protein|nr:hypothetical protein [Rhodocyclaceae bacterium]
MLIEATQALSKKLAFKIVKRIHAHGKAGRQLALQRLVFAMLLLILSVFFIALFALIQDASPFTN